MHIKSLTIPFFYELNNVKYPRGNDYHNYGKSPFVVDLPIKDGDFPLLC